jgi:lysophospholipase L1-like esterase
MVGGPASNGTDRLRAGAPAGFVVGAVAGLLAVVLLAFAGVSTSPEPAPVRPPGDARSGQARPGDPPARRPGGALRVMPLGDSITAGVGSRSGGSYRTALYDRLRGAGLDVDFVGSQRSGPGADPDHEGHGGWTVERITAEVDGWLAAYEPDVVLLHIGTNNVTRGEPPARIAGKLTALVDRIRAARPHTYVLVSQIVSSRVPAERVVGHRYNARILRIAAERGPFVWPVPQSTVTGGDLRDIHHPNDSGYLKMARNFYTALTRVLPAPPATAPLAAVPVVQG